ncbi:small glutamine-rich tetratricopeptide repeat-containing protein alpha-like isoform X4 [Osmia bicornis bicornis]|uniref:small glutamine-rich tetratricopeptide repeat-containing protein alpha-like isoform X4 n=1 Tax=Osmia bicornis bicornis TaxID=1437191 RepID=UPI0010F6A67A|nr:small glutamine-rich tetratricopeptide repeat-containing protein alpha-like isoform X4 [Osmia bicornis bicornis]
MAVKGLVAAIVQFLTQQLKDGDITADSRESLEVAIQCLESAYNVQASDAPGNLNLYEVYKSAIENAKPQVPEATPEAKAEAERLKNEGNALMKAEKHHEALANYTKAIQLDGRNAVYYCNRAAAYSKIGNHQQAIKDCHNALSIDPFYSKAYGRLGLAYSSLDRHKEAKESYQKALNMEPDNESYKNNLQVAEEKLAQQGMSNMGLGGALQNMVGNFISENAEQGVRMDALLEAGHQFAHQLQNTNPELIESLRRQMGGNPNDPDPPQQN